MRWGARGYARSSTYVTGRSGTGNGDVGPRSSTSDIAWLGAILIEAGYRPLDPGMTEIIERWRSAPATACEAGNSVAYLRRSGQVDDFDFVTTHVDDLEIVCSIDGNEVRPLRYPKRAGAA